MEYFEKFIGLLERLAKIQKELLILILMVLLFGNQILDIIGNLNV